MMDYLLICGIVASVVLAAFAKKDKNYGDMRVLIIVALLFFFLWLDKII